MILSSAAPTPSASRAACLALCGLSLSIGPAASGAAAGDATVTAPQTAPAAPAARPTWTIPRAPAPARIDGQLDDAVWQSALIVELPYEVSPGENTPAPVRTECLLAYDADRLYVAFRAHDPEPGKIRAHLCDRDRAYRDDFAGIIIDPFNDERRGFEFFVNPLGVQMDLSRNDVGSGDSEDDSWDALWASAGRITATGYDVEMAIPFSSLRFPRASGPMTWGLYPFRAWPRTDRHQLTAIPEDRNKDCFFCQIPKVVGFEGATPGRALEITPTFTASRTSARHDFPAGPLESDGIEAEPGVSVQWGVTPNLTLNGTLNPDFSQVEADVAQLDVNRRFALFFPEKRPFFLEGADFFSTPLRVVHTRAIADPDFGIKVTGKLGKTAIGGFVARDAVTNILIPGNQGSTFAQIDEPVLDAVVRVRRDIGAGSTVGMLVTARDGDSYENFVAGIDARIRLTKVDSLSFELLDTRTRYPAAFAREHGQSEQRFGGLGGRAEYFRNSRDWSWWVGHTDKRRGFRADLGFITQADVRGPFAGFQRIFNPTRPTWYKRLAFGLEADHAESQNGDLTSQYLHATWNYRGPYQMDFNGNVGPTRESFEGVTYELLNTWFFFNMRPTGDFTSSLDFTFGDRIDFANSRKGQVLNLTPGITFDPGRHLRLQLDHTFEQLSARGERVYTANLAQLKAIYQFDTRMFVRAIVQLTHIDRNVANYADQKTDPLTRRLFTQLLFSYKLSGQTLFHIGYSDNRLGERDIDLTETDHTLFLKLSYAWRP